MSTERSLLHLMQLVSPALPVGAYAYSQGLEYAVERQWVADLPSTETWIAEVMSHSLAHLDLALLRRLMQACATGDAAALVRWTDCLQASRESRELLLEDQQMGAALQRLLLELELPTLTLWPAERPPSFATMFAIAAVEWQIPPGQALHGFVWSWLENQVAAAIKLVPLGQTQGQKLLVALMPRVEDCVARSAELADADIGLSLPRLALASMQHETQYSRLFRS